MRFVLTAHRRQAATMLRRVKESERLWFDLEQLVVQAGLPYRTLAALFDAALGLRVRNGTYQAALQDSEDEVSDQAAGRDLRELVEAGLLLARGRARGRFYVASEQLQQVRMAIVSRRGRRDDSDPFQGA